jgi:hypothetical protein
MKEMMKKGQLDPNQLQQYLQQKAAASQGGKDAMDARLLAESLKANGVQAA